MSVFCVFFFWNMAKRLMFLLFKIMKFMLSKGHEQDALKLMSTYLPKDGSGGSAYQEGGGLFALGTT